MLRHSQTGRCVDIETQSLLKLTQEPTSLPRVDWFRKSRNFMPPRSPTAKPRSPAGKGAVPAAANALLQKLEQREAQLAATSDKLDRCFQWISACFMPMKCAVRGMKLRACCYTG
jgi:hypothetical protein